MPRRVVLLGRAHDEPHRRVVVREGRVAALHAEADGEGAVDGRLADAHGDLGRRLGVVERDDRRVEDHVVPEAGPHEGRRPDGAAPRVRAQAHLHGRRVAVRLGHAHLGGPGPQARVPQLGARPGRQPRRELARPVGRQRRVGVRRPREEVAEALLEGAGAEVAEREGRTARVARADGGALLPRVGGLGQEGRVGHDDVEAREAAVAHVGHVLGVHDARLVRLKVAERDARRRRAAAAAHVHEAPPGPVPVAAPHRVPHHVALAGLPRVFKVHGLQAREAVQGARVQVRHGRRQQ
mmetsp:Transcript_22085/g.66287  ORF Transcript_22085/g.66287 Transcript_22085/m.66287 type:complete len:295 (-) Transcript_22085:1391-2275(-)